MASISKLSAVRPILRPNYNSNDYGLEHLLILYNKIDLFLSSLRLVLKCFIVHLNVQSEKGSQRSAQNSKTLKPASVLIILCTNDYYVY